MITKKNFIHYVELLYKLLDSKLYKNKIKEFLAKYRKDKFFKAQIKNYIFDDDMELVKVNNNLLHFIEFPESYISDYE